MPLIFQSLARKRELDHWSSMNRLGHERKVLVLDVHDEGQVREFRIAQGQLQGRKTPGGAVVDPWPRSLIGRVLDVPFEGQCTLVRKGGLVGTCDDGQVRPRPFARRKACTALDDRVVLPDTPLRIARVAVVGLVTLVMKDVTEVGASF